MHYLCTTKSWSNKDVMNYQETIEYLFAQLPVFESQGAHAYKPGLERCEGMDDILGHPHRQFRTIHIAGTNGKGSTSHTLASILQCAGYKVGLFTSPHLVDFSERIRVNGEEIDHNYVVEWTERHIEELKVFQPSFFELATMMGFCYFADRQVDVAIIEVGLGGRLDSTNIITPTLSVITNISMDHTQFLGDTLPQIAAEKAGIMKPGVPCVIGECDDEHVRFTFEQNGQLHEVCELDFACDRRQIKWVKRGINNNMYVTLDDGELESPLLGNCQPKNANTVLTAVHQLRKIGLVIPAEAVTKGFKEVCSLTHLRGRWETLATYPDNSTRVLCDTGHNEGCFSYIGPQLKGLIEEGHPMHIVFGMVSDKDIEAVLRQLPQKATYYFCNAPTPRALAAQSLADMARRYDLKGNVYPTINEAIDAALAQCHEKEIVFVGGSNFIVCEAMKRKL